MAKQVNVLETTTNCHSVLPKYFVMEKTQNFYIQHHPGLQYPSKFFGKEFGSFLGKLAGTIVFL